MAYTTKVRLRDQYIRKDGKTNFQLVVYINRKRKYYPIDVYIEPKYWNGTKILASNIYNKEYNKILKDAILKSENCMVEIVNENKQLNFENFEEKYFDKNENELTIVQAFQNYIDYYKNDKLNKATINVYKSQISKFIDFAGTEFLLKNVDQQFFMKYRQHLVQNKQNSQNTIVNSLKKLKAVINFSIKMDLLNENKLQFVSERYQETNRQSLSLSEVEQLENLLYSNTLSQKLQNVLILFLFSCYTGIRFSDIQSLTGKNIADNFVCLVQQKIKHETQRELFIPITKRCEKLMETYLQIDKNERLFSKISNQKANDYLKLIFLHPKINIDYEITFHSARHTFAMLALDFELPIEYLQHLLGHSDIKTTKIYGKYQKQLIKKISKKHLDY
jgi:integrase/recombinase XerC